MATMTSGDGRAAKPHPPAARLLFAVCLLLAVSPFLAAWGSGPKCGDTNVRQALGRALDNTFAETRKMAQIAVTVEDIVVVDEGATRAACKAMLHIAFNYMNIQRGEQDSVIEYLAESSDRGNVLVTITTRP